MDLFFALRGGQIGRSVMWSNGAILPILGIICILSIAGVILIYSYSAAFEAFRKSLREKTARYLAIFLVLMELCGMTYVDLYHTHLLGRLGKTAAKLSGRGSRASRAAQKISRLPLDSPAYKLFKDIEKYQRYGDNPYTGVSPYTLKANIEEVLEDKKLDPDIRQELERVYRWSLGEVQKRKVRDRVAQAEEDAQWEKIKNTTDPEADTMAVNRFRRGGEMSQEQLEDYYRTILLAGGDREFALKPATIDYARGLIGDRLSLEDYARIENEARAISARLPPNTPPLGGAYHAPGLDDIANMSVDALRHYVNGQLARETGQLDEHAAAAFTRYQEYLAQTEIPEKREAFIRELQNRHPEVLSSHPEGAPAPPVQPAPTTDAVPVLQPSTNSVPTADQSLMPVDTSTGPHPGQNALAGSGSSQYHPSGQLNGGNGLSPPPTNIPSRQAQAFVPGAGPVVPKTAPPPPSPPTPQKSFIRDTAGNVLSLGSYPTLMPLSAEFPVLPGYRRLLQKEASLLVGIG